VRGVLPWLLFLLPLPAVFGSLFLGRYGIGAGEVWGALAGAGGSEVVQALVLRIRLPRVVAAALVGAALASSGAVFQGVFRNPLVESRILGVSSGAALGAALALLFGLGGAALQGLAFGLGLLAAGLVALLGWAFGGGVLVLVVAGVLVNSFLTSILGLVKYVADPLGTLPALTFWLLGGISTVRWADLAPVAAVVGPGLALLLLLRWRLNLLTLSEAEATALGVAAGRARFSVIGLGTLLTAAAVSISGVVGWVGLVVPHAARALVGPDHARLIPASIGLGAALLILLDDLARTAFPSEIPLGILSGLLGAPVFAVLLLRLWRDRGGWR